MDNVWYHERAQALQDVRQPRGYALILFRVSAEGVFHTM